MFEIYFKHDFDVPHTFPTNNSSNSLQVHILSHIPPGNGDCWTIFSREFAKIINRFESTVAAQFYGHTHNDEYKIFYDAVQTDRPINVAFVAPSLTTYSNMNPGYRTYTIDGPRSGSTWVCL